MAAVQPPLRPDFTLPAQVQPPLPQGGQSVPVFIDIFTEILTVLGIPQQIIPVPGQPAVPNPVHTRLVLEFRQLDDNRMYELLSSLITPIQGAAPGQRQYTISAGLLNLIAADRDLDAYGSRLGLNNNPLWSGLKEEFAVLQVHSLVKRRVNVDEFLRLLGRKVRTLNQLIEADRNVPNTIGPPIMPGPDTITRRGPPGAQPGTGMGPFAKKYLKYKEKYLKLKNELDNK